MKARRGSLTLAVSVAAALAAVVLVTPVATQGPRSRAATVMVDGHEAVEGEVLLRYHENTGDFEAQRAEFEVEADEVEPLGQHGIRRMRSRRLSTQAMLQALRANPDVEYAEPNYILRLAATPNDPSFGSLWGLLNSGQTISGSVGIIGSDIKATTAWDITTGSRDNVVGVIDTGIDFNHPDLAANIWSAPQAFSVTLGFGLVINCAAGTHGFNAINNTCNPMDDNVHGTHVAGTIGAVGNNGTGVAGVNWIANMMGLKFLSASGSGSTSNAIKAIEFAIQAKAVFGAAANVRILSNSWGGGGFSQSLKNAIDAANTANMLFPAAAGNDGTNNDSIPHFPSSYTSANVISVASTTNRDARSSFSNFGATSVHLGAPGSGILSTVLNNGFSFFNGTSMATPQVAGAAALLLAACNLTTAELKAALLNNVDLISAMSGITTTGGRLNVNAALSSCLTSSATVTASLVPGTITGTVANGPGNPQDWLGLYCPATNGDTTITQWKYLNGTTTPPATGLRSATVTFTAPSGNFNCNLRLFLNNGFTKLATSGTVQPPTLTASPSAVNGNGTISVTLANGPANPADWVGLFLTSGADTAFLNWNYLNGTRTPPSPGVSNGTVQFTAPNVSGTYDIRLFANNGFTKLATSNVVTVTAQTPQLSINDITLNEGNSGTTTATFTVTLSPVNASQTVTVNFATADGTATTANNDYASTSGTLTFNPSVATRTVTVNVTGDAVRENNETVLVNLSTAANATILDSQGIATIVNDDPPILTVTTNVAPGGTINVSVSNNPFATTTDWVGLFTTAAADAAYQDWRFLNGTQTSPGAPVLNPSFQFTAPAVAGTYNLRLFFQNGFSRLATSATVTVAATPTVTATAAVAAGGGIDVGVANGPANQADWIGIFPTGAADNAYLDWFYLSGLKTPPATGVSSASLRLTAPATAGTFEIRLFANNGFTRLASSGTVTVSVPTITATSPVNAGGTITVTVSGGPANRTDWVGLFTTAGADGAFQDWMYLSGSRTPPASGVSGATINFPAPVVPGTYNLRFFANNGFTRLATSLTVTVNP